MMADAPEKENDPLLVTAKPSPPEEPKKPPSAYNLFVRQFRVDHAKEMKGLSASAVMKKASEAWNLLDEDGKTPFVEKCNEEKQEYANRLQQFIEFHSGSKMGGAFAIETKAPKKPKNPLSGYMLFAKSYRDSHEDAGKGKSCTETMKLIGEAWKGLGDEEKDVFQEKSRRLKEEYEEQMADYKLKTGGQEESGRDETEYDVLAHSLYPEGTVRKVIKIDPDIQNVSKESIELISKAAELFTASLTNDAVSVLRSEGKKTITRDHLHRLFHCNPSYVFLRGSFPESGERELEHAPLRQKRKQTLQSQSGQESEPLAKKPSSKKITSFFKPKE